MVVWLEIKLINMGTRWGQIVREESKHSKGIGEYTKCQSEVLAYSSILLLAGKNCFVLFFSVCFVILNLLLKHPD